MEMKKYKFISANEYCVRVFDGTHDSPKPCEKGYKLLTSKNILAGELDKTSAYYISENDYNAINQRSKVQQYDILFSMIGSVGNVCFVKDSNIDFAIKNMGVFSCENKEKALYLYYYLQSPFAKKMIDSYLNGAVQKFLGLERLRNFPILEYSTDKQKIAAILSSLDDKIVLNKKINAKLEAMAKRLYDYWFVQFDFPNEEGKPYKTSGGKMVWNEVLKREIPEGWEVVQIKKIFENEIPGDWGEEQQKKNNTYQVSCIRGCDMVTMNDLPIRYILPSNATKLLKPNDFVIEISGGSPTQSTGRIVQITEEIINRFNGNVICSNFCHGVRILNKKYISYFLRMWNMFYDNKVFFNYEGKTSGLKNFQFDTFVENKWYMPPEDIVKKYDLTVNKIKAKIDKNESENLKLTAMRDRLLPLLMNGQVEVEG